MSVGRVGFDSENASTNVSLLALSTPEPPETSEQWISGPRGETRRALGDPTDKSVDLVSLPIFQREPSFPSSRLCG